MPIHNKKYYINRMQLLKYSCALLDLYKRHQEMTIGNIVDEYLETLEQYNSKFREIDDEEWDMLPGGGDIDGM